MTSAALYSLAVSIVACPHDSDGVVRSITPTSPMWLQTTSGPESLATGLVRARDALEARNAMIRARMSYVWEGDERIQYARSSRDGIKFPRPIAQIAVVREKFERLAEDGDTLRLIAIVHEMRDGRRAETQFLEERDVCCRNQGRDV